VNASKNSRWKEPLSFPSGPPPPVALSSNLSPQRRAVRQVSSRCWSTK